MLAPVCSTKEKIHFLETQKHPKNRFEEARWVMKKGRRSKQIQKISERHHCVYISKEHVIFHGKMNVSRNLEEMLSVYW